MVGRTVRDVERDLIMEGRSSIARHRTMPPTIIRAHLDRTLRNKLKKYADGA